ncbi:MAG TPA: cytochrome c family protein, partial [Oceanicaulis sp.]|nr:cytochrome c family protein [Oceanicaulis sp.]
GARFFRRRQACHTVEEGGRNMVGPNLHGVFGRESGHKDDFRYSPAMSESEVVWSAETLDAYLTNPREYIRGNRMSFAGLRDEQDRHDLIAWLAINTH